MADTADLDYVHVVQRLGATVGDTPDDVDSDPDFVPVTEGTITIVPTLPEAKVMVNGASVSVMNAPIVCTVDAQGYLSYQGTRGVWIVDLGSSKVTPPVPRDKAAYTVTYSGLKFGTQVFKKTPVSINPDATALAGGDFNLTDATSLPLPSGVTIAYIQGIADQAVAAAQSITDQKGVPGGIAALSADGDVLDASGDVVTGGLGDAGIAPLVTDPASATGAALASTFAVPALTRPPRYRKRPALTMVTTFQAGANPFVSNTGTWTADTTDYALGTQSIKVAGPGFPSYLGRGLPAVDLTNKNLAMLVKVDQPTNIYQIQLFVGTANLANYKTTVAGSGGGPANTTIEPGVWTWIYFPASDVAGGTGTVDMTAITDWEVRVAGTPSSGGAYTFWVNAIATFPRQVTYPNGVVSIAFDDNYTNALDNGLPVLDKYGWGATAFTIVEAVTTSTAGFITHERLQQLEDVHGWEVAGHAYTFAAHGAGFTTLTQPALEDELGNLRQWLKDNQHKGADLFAYPLGDDNQNVVQTVGNYFTLARQIVRTPLQTLTLDAPLRIRSYSVSSSDTLAVLQAAVDRAYAAGSWLVFTFHHLVTGTPAAGTEWNAANFTSLMAYIAGKGMPVLPVGAVLDTTR